MCLTQYKTHCIDAAIILLTSEMVKLAHLLLLLLYGWSCHSKLVPAHYTLCLITTVALSASDKTREWHDAAGNCGPAMHLFCQICALACYVEHMAPFRFTKQLFVWRGSGW